MAVYLYNIPEIIRPFVTNKLNVTQPFKRNDCIWISLVRNGKGLTWEQVSELAEKGYHVSTNTIEFQRHPSSVTKD